MTKVSVIVPVYNVAPYLRQCMDSLVGQTLREIEVICVDDGSTDGSGAILDEYAVRDSRIRVIHQANAGAGAARNAGLAMATGEYLFFCDPDDWCRREMLAKLYGKARRTSADVLVASVRGYESETGRLLRVRRLSGWPRGVFGARQLGDRLFTLSRQTVWDKLFRRAFVFENSLRFQETPRYNDMLFCDLSLACARRIAVLHYAGYCHRSGRPGGLQFDRASSPELVLDVLDAIRAELNRRGLFEGCEAAYARLLFGNGMMFAFDSRDWRTYERFYAAFAERIREFWPRYGHRLKKAYSSDPAHAAFDPDLNAQTYVLRVACASELQRRAHGRGSSWRTCAKALVKALLPSWLLLKI